MSRTLTFALLLAALAGPATAADPTPAPPASDAAMAIFASGCFWCTEADFEKVPGVVEVVSGYIGGSVADPSYRQVSAGGTGHAEAARVVYDPNRVTYEQLLDVYWHNVDFLDDGGQFCDRGNQYRPEIFVLTPEQEEAAKASKTALEQSGRWQRPIVVRITPAGTFYPAEDYHQNYYKKNSIQYKFYRWNCGRDQRLEQLWSGHS